MADLLTVSDVARHLRLDDFAPHYELLDALITAAQAVIEREANRDLDTASERTEYHTPLVLEGRGCIYVDNPPILATTCPVIYDDYRYSQRLLSSADWIRSIDDGGINYNAGKIELWNTESFFAQDRLNVKITYTGGWTATTIPGDLLQAWINLVAFWFENPDRIGLTELQDGSYRTIWERAEVPQQLLDVFRAYRVQSVRV